MCTYLGLKDACEALPLKVEQQEYAGQLGGHQSGVKEEVTECTLLTDL